MLTSAPTPNRLDPSKTEKKAFVNGADGLALTNVQGVTEQRIYFLAAALYASNTLAIEGSPPPAKERVTVGMFWFLRALTFLPKG